MQILTIKVKDDLVTEVISVLEQFKDSIQILKELTFNRIIERGLEDFPKVGYKRIKKI